VSVEFLNRLWHEYGNSDLRCMQATSILLDRMLRYRSRNWAFVLAFIKRGCISPIKGYVDGWITGHFLPVHEIAEAAAEIEKLAKRLKECR
jgi:hypothetical protein